MRTSVSSDWFFSVSVVSGLDPCGACDACRDCMNCGRVVRSLSLSLRLCFELLSECLLDRRGEAVDGFPNARANQLRLSLPWHPGSPWSAWPSWSPLPNTPNRSGCSPCYPVSVKNTSSNEYNVVRTATDLFCAPVVLLQNQILLRGMQSVAAMITQHGIATV